MLAPLLAILLVASLAGSAATQAQTPSDPVLADSPKGYWKLGEATGNFIDSSTTPGGHPGVYSVLAGGSGGSGFHRGLDGTTLRPDGLIRDDAAPSGFGQSPQGASVFADKTTGSCATDPTFEFGSRQPFSIEIWIRPSAHASGFQGGIMGNYRMDGSGSINIGYGLYLAWPARTLTFERKDFGFANSVSTPVPAYEWSHVAATYDGTTMTLYVNGDSVGQTTSTGNLPSGACIVRIGAFTFDFGFTDYPGYFYGSLDHASVYDSALSEARVEAHYEAGFAAVSKEQTFGSCARGGGAKATCNLLADPVSTAIGSFTHEVEDVSLPGTGVPFHFTRFYNSLDPTDGPLGVGWTHSHASALTVQGNGDVTVRAGDGKQIDYEEQPNGSFVGADGSLSVLASVAGGYELTQPDQVVHAFDSTGRLERVEDPNGEGLAYAYNGSGQLTSVTDAEDRVITLTYNAGKLTTVELPDGRTVSYGYTSGRLTSVTDVRNKQWTYTYESHGWLDKEIDPLAHTVFRNVYNADGRVIEQYDALNKKTTFAWDPITQTATVTDARDNTWKDVYDSNILQKRIDALGNVTRLGYDGDLNGTSVKGPDGSTTTMTYDAAGNMLTATAPPSLGSAQKTFVYNARNDPELVTDARGKVTDYAYNPTTGNLTSVTQDGTQVGGYTYDAAGRVETFTDGNEKTWTYTYFPATGYLQSSTDPLGNKTTYTYDTAGRVATRVDPKGNVAGCNCAADFTWTYTYNPAGQLLTEQNPLGHTTTNVYDDAGRLTSATDALGRTTSYTYDDANRLLTQTAPDPDGAGPLTTPVTTFTYDNVGNNLTETDPRGNTTTFAYDADNRLISTTGPDPDGGGPLTAPVTTNSYDANGNLASTVEPRGSVQGANPDDYRTTFTYDAAGRMLTETHPDPDGAGPQTAPVTTNVYDPVGNLQSVRDGNNHIMSYTYDAAGRILTVTGPDLGVTTYTYDDAGNVLTRTDDNGHTTTFAYDNVGRLVSETSPDPDGPGPQVSAVMSYTYDPNGNRLTLTDPNGNATGTAGDGQTTYGYDRANRQTSIDYSDTTPDVTFTLDAAGNRLTMADGSGTETRTYDALDRLLSVTRGSSTFSYVYDVASNVTRRTHPGGTVVDYGYDPLNRLSTVASGSQTTSYAYDPASNLTQTTLPAGNGYVETRVYDRAGRLTEVKNQQGTSVLSHFVSTLDPVGNPTQVVRSGTLSETQTYTYDANDRITSVCLQSGTCPGPTDPFIRWTYDKVGNRLSEQRPTGTTSYTYDGRDSLLSAGLTSFDYDQNGNELSAGLRTFAYDLANRLKTTTLGATTTTYTYDGDGKRLQASTGPLNAQKTNYLWDVNFGLPQLARELDGGGSLLREYVYGERMISMTAGSDAFYYHYDQLGSAVNMTTSSGATSWTYGYEPFGSTRTELPGSVPPTNLMKYTGEYLDPTGLYHLRMRQYDPSWGRFLHLDPVSMDKAAPAASGYGYVDNRPTTSVDPSGMVLRPADDGRVAPHTPSSPVAEFGISDLAIEPPGPAGRRRVAFTFQYFMDRGLRYFQSAGLVGNFLQETGGTLDPRTKQGPLVPGGPHGPGRGIAQWEIGGRWDALIDFADRGRVSPWALATQVRFVWHELTTFSYFGLSSLKRTKNVRNATRVVLDKYERAGAEHFDVRLAYAKYVLRNFG